METRKLVSFGNSSFVISLPKSWVMKNSLKKGDSVNIEEGSYELIVTARDARRSRPAEITIHTEGRNQNEMKTEIMAAYVNNYSVMRITGENIRGISANLKKVIHGLVGMEIVEENSSTIVVKDLLDISEVSMDNIVRRIDLLLKSMMDDCLDPAQAGGLYERDEEVNRLALLALRVFRAATENPSLLKLFSTTYWNIFISRQVTVKIEHIGDYTKRISRMVAERGRGNNSDVEGLFGSLRERYRETMKIYYGRDKKAAYSMEGEVRRLLQECDKILDRKPTVANARLVENLKHMTKAIMYILRDVMEQD